MLALAGAKALAEPDRLSERSPFKPRPFQDCGLTIPLAG